MTPLLAGIAQARARAIRFFAAQRVEWEGTVAWRHDPGHDPGADPGLLLYGSWAGVHAGRLLGVLPPPGHPDRVRMARALGRFQLPDGTFAMPGRVAGQGTGHDAEYDRFHWTNYAWGAMHALGEAPPHGPGFLVPLLDAAALEAWLARRDLDRPWAEGNNLVNLASFLALTAAGGNPEAAARLDDMRAWHRLHQRTDTGFWHSRSGARTAGTLYAMAGAAHSLHLFLAAGVPVPRGSLMVDTTLGTCDRGLLSACIDLDRVDILTHLRPLGHRVHEVDAWLRDLLVELLDVQLPDGGFADTYTTGQVTYGHETPARTSVGWITWFRMATVGMIACALFPDQVGAWHFRTSLGSGYARMPAPGQAGPPSDCTGMVPASRRWRLRARRSARWARQRLTSRLRAMLAGAS